MNTIIHNILVHLFLIIYVLIRKTVPAMEMFLEYPKKYFYSYQQVRKL